MLDFFLVKIKIQSERERERKRDRENNLEMEKRRGKNISEYTKILSNSTVMNTLVKQYKYMIPPAQWARTLPGLELMPNRRY